MKGIFVAVMASVLAVPAWGWWGDGHVILTRAAIRTLPAGVPAFFRAGEEVVASCVYDPDLFKNRETPHLYNAEHSEHYFDQELVAGIPLPPTRYAFIEMCAREGIAPAKVGLLPYMVAEWTERLAVAFAGHRKWPANKAIQSKCLVYAGLLAHYAQDLCQPLHLTIHFDGRVRADGSSAHTGIHEKVDALVERLEFNPDGLASGQIVAPCESLMPAILAEIEESRDLIDRVYELEEELAPTTSPEGRALAEERARAAVNFTTGLYLTAWELSAKIKLPGWFRPPGTGE